MAPQTGRPIFKLLRLSQYPILEQLRLEQALLRVDRGSWLLINDGTPDPAIVMGVSGKLEELVHRAEAKAAGVPVIRRFSGGGTVAVDQDTIFATLVSDDKTLPEVEAYPRPLMEWTEKLYHGALGQFGDFKLRENDYCFRETKIGGNAQAITRGRWLHHTSFLWDYRDSHMALLKHPTRAPAYREGREHLEFVSRLRDEVPSRQALLDALPEAMRKAGFDLQETSLEEAQESLKGEHFKSTRLVDL